MKTTQPDFIYFNDTLIIEAISIKKKVLYFVAYFVPLCILIILYTLGFIPYYLIFIIAIFLWYTYKTFLTFPANFTRIILSKYEYGIQINHKRIPFEDLLFLSIREDELYKQIRIEAKRKNILFSNEKILFSHCKNFEHAISLCRELKKFIDPNLKINQIKIGSARSSSLLTSDSAGSPNSKVEVWNYID